MVLLDVGPAWDGDLEQEDLLQVLGVVGEQALEGLEPVDEALGVVEPVNAQDYLSKLFINAIFEFISYNMVTPRVLAIDPLGIKIFLSVETFLIPLPNYIYLNYGNISLHIQQRKKTNDRETDTPTETKS